MVNDKPDKQLLSIDIDCFIFDSESNHYKKNASVYCSSPLVVERLISQFVSLTGWLKNKKMGKADRRKNMQMNFRPKLVW